MTITVPVQPNGCFVLTFAFEDDANSLEYLKALFSHALLSTQKNGFPFGFTNRFGFFRVTNRFYGCFSSLGFDIILNRFDSQNNPYPDKNH